MSKEIKVIKQEYNLLSKRFNNFVNEFNDVKKKNNLELGVII